jgi:hypothetical protein
MFRLNNSVDPGWGGGNFSHQMFVVLIDNAEGGTTDGVLASNVEVQAEYPWDIGFYGDNWVKRFFTPETIATPQTSGTGITTSYEYTEDGEHWFEMYVPETLLGDVADETWKYYVMVASSDFNNFRNHMAENGEWNFGGGDDGAYDPNYLDILVPNSDDPVALQELISSSYDVSNQVYAKMLAVGHGLIFVEDTTAPVVTITSPADNSEYNWTTGDEYTIVVEYTAVDAIQGTYNGIDTVKVYLNSVYIPEASDTSATLSFVNGTNVIRVVATDISGNTAYAEITVIVKDLREPGTTDDDDDATDDDDGIKIPGFSLGFLAVSVLGASFLILRRRR